MTDLWKTDETAFARELANKVLDRVNADPDDDLAVLARQFLRARELADKYKDQVLDTCKRAERAERGLREIAESDFAPYRVQVHARSALNGDAS